MAERLTSKPDGEAITQKAEIEEAELEDVSDELKSWEDIKKEKKA
jgi:hypothetical protein